MTFKEKLAQGFKEALVQKGKRKGLLKAQCPPVGSYGSAVWQGLISVANPYKIGLAHIMFMTDECKEIYRHVAQSVEGKDVSFMDKDAEVFKRIGLM